MRPKQGLPVPRSKMSPSAASTFGLVTVSGVPAEEIKKAVEAKKTELGISDKGKAGILVGAVMKELRGRADGNDVKRIVDSLFN